MHSNLVREIRNVAIAVGIFGIVQLMAAVIIGYFNAASLLGTAVGCALAVFNFSLMGFILEKCMNGKGRAAGIVGVGYILRLVIIAAVVIWAMKVSYLNYVCVVIPLIFPQIAVFILNKRKENGK